MKNARLRVADFLFSDEQNSKKSISLGERRDECCILRKIRKFGDAETRPIRVLFLPLAPMQVRGLIAQAGDVKT